MYMFKPILICTSSIFFRLLLKFKIEFNFLLNKWFINIITFLLCFIKCINNNINKHQYSKAINGLFNFYYLYFS